MRYKRSLGDHIFSICNGIFMGLIVIATLYPLWYMLVASISSPSALAKHGAFMILPQDITLMFYKSVLSSKSLLTGYKNTIIIVFFGTSLNLILTSFAAYALSRKWLMGRNLMMLFITIPMFFSGGLVPSYLLVRQLGLFNTYAALILPSAVGTWNIIMMRTYIMTLGDELEQSAKIDGANDIQILFRVILPVCTPIIAVIGLFCAVGYWNSWFAASIYLKDSEKFPLQLILRSILLAGSKNGMGEVKSGAGTGVEVAKGLKYATVIVSTIPILCVYPFLQKYFVKGIMVGSLKG